jgi:hypothetical protein
MPRCRAAAVDTGPPRNGIVLALVLEAAAQSRTKDD